MRAKPGNRATPVPGPQFVGYFGPVIEALKQLGGSARPAEVRERVVKNLGVSEDLQTEVKRFGQLQSSVSVQEIRGHCEPESG